MRFKLVLKVEREQYGDLLPLSYSYEFGSWVYKVLGNSDSIYASWLHDNGFRLQGRAFKGFVFSRLLVPEYRIYEDRMQIKSNQVELYISFLPEKSTEQFVKGIFSEQEFRIGDARSRVAFRVDRIELMPLVNYRPVMEFETLSPMTVSLKEAGRIIYFSPESPEVKELLFSNLINRYRAFYGKEFTGDPDFDFELLNVPKPVLITIKSGTPEQTKIKGYNCRFRLRASEELMKIAYESGMGEKGSLGFGMIRDIIR